MSSENAVRTAVGFIVMIMVGAVLSAVAGGLFGAFVAKVSPEFVGNLFEQSTAEGLVRYAFAVGMIWGLFIGAAASGFACLLATIIKVWRIRLVHRQGPGGTAG